MKFSQTKQVAIDLVYAHVFFLFYKVAPTAKKNNHIHVTTAFTPELSTHAILKMYVVQIVGF